MSLTTLTFGSKRTGFETQNALISTPVMRASQPLGKTPLKAGKILVKKACRFYSHDNIFVVGEVSDGFIAENMRGQFKDREIQIVDVESKYGHNAKKGMAVGIFLSGVDETELEAGTELDFRVL